ncbi:hypothetical protein THOG05_10282 [Vibrio rotiferianus]|uniref:hypothetical protein n=1 Tax=Vibrio rotiferianus TaxID=190895 RepID=UPI002894DF8B|nr:hypothetical protein THOG05_10282 [Vibrio rotiferianus]
MTFEVNKTTAKEVCGSFGIIAKFHAAADQDSAFSFTSTGDATLGEAELMVSNVECPIYQFKRRNNDLVFISKSDGESYKLQSVFID